jgi:hypothetical protein
MTAPVEPLLNTLPATYGSVLDGHILEQYKLYVETSQKLSDRRLSTNNYLFTINSSLLTLLGILATLLPEPKALAIIPAAGCLLSVAWILMLTSFKRLNAAKFDVIRELEKNLPANVFGKEWEYLTKNASHRYSALSDVERFVPVLFAVFYVGISIFIWNLPTKTDKATRIVVESPVHVDLSK